MNQSPVPSTRSGRRHPAPVDAESSTPLLPAVVEAMRARSTHGDGRMAVMFFEFQHKPSLVETAFELAHRHLGAGDAVDFRFLGHDLTPTFLSPVAGSALIGPWLPERRAARLIAHPALRFVPRVRLDKAPLPFAVPDTLEALMDLRHDGFDVGMAVASSMISQTRNSRFDPSAHKDVVRKVLQGALAVFAYAKDVLRRERPDLVHVYNGRLAYERAVLRACKVLDVPHLVYEMGSTPRTFFLQPFTTHDKVRVQEVMRTTWQEARHHPEAIAVAEAWFQERRDGRPSDWPSFTAGQARSRVPDGLGSERVIAYFSSSDDEYAAISDAFRWNGWRDQFDAIQGLIRVVETLENTRLVLRVHPHLTRKHPTERARWLSLAGMSSNLTVIAPESDVDTYALIDAADVVVTGGSTVGVEAVFWGRPTILLGPSEYDELDVAHIAHDGPTLEALLRSADLITPRDPALAYGYYRATHGEPFEVYRPTAFHHGTFLGADLRPPLWRVLANARSRVGSRMRRFRLRLG